MKKAILFMTVVFFVIGLVDCGSTGGSNPSQTQQNTETQKDKFERILAADFERLEGGSDKKATLSSIEAVLKPRTITQIGEITDTVLSEPGRPYYFKIRAIYKGFDQTNEKARLQDIGTATKANNNTRTMTMGAVFGVDTTVYSVDKLDIETLPTEANSIADFYLIAVRVTEQSESAIAIYITFVRNIEKSGFDPGKFIVANGMRYITVNDARVPSQQEMMMNMMTGEAMRNSGSNVFDPITYPLVDLMDARVAMDKKDLRNNYTFPRVRVKYVSEVVFKGQTNTVIIVSTSDNVLTEKMNFTGRASTIKNGEKIRVYYTIAKDPLEIWEIQAIERL